MPALRDVRLAWKQRPASYSRPIWGLLLVLDRLPWPWGEEILARVFAARALVQTERLRRALTWAVSQPDAGRRPWSLALALCSCHGRFIARSALVGVRDAETLRRLMVVRGGEHLARARGGAILLGFHLGPAGSYLALRVAGHRLTWVGGRGASGAWSREIRRLYQDPAEARLFSEGRGAWLRRLYHARRILLAGENIFISADGAGAAAFSVPVPGGPVIIGAGWLALRRATGAPVLPVLSHMEGRRQVVTIHPPLPALDPDPIVDVEACRQALGRLLNEHVRRVPEQCYSLVFWAPPIEGARSPALRRTELPS